jgi:hypothetical protein
MPTYRIYYAEREVSESDLGRIFEKRGSPLDAEVVTETDWEEQVEGRDEEQALKSFMREHVRDRDRVLEVDDDGRSHPLEKRDAYDPERTYIWAEDGRLMEYQGMDEATPGMVTCPLCEGAGEVPEEVAEEFESLYGEEEEEPAW